MVDQWFYTRDPRTRYQTFLYEEWHPKIQVAILISLNHVLIKAVVCTSAKCLTHGELIPFSIAWSYKGYTSPPGMGCHSNTRLSPRILPGFPEILLVPIYAPGLKEIPWEWNVLPKNITHWQVSSSEPSTQNPVN